MKAMVGPVGTAPRKYNDYDSSHIPAAGATFPADDSAATCLKWPARPRTPTGIAKYRQSRLHEPGQIYKHFGFAGDPVDRARVYGRVRKTHSWYRRLTPCLHDMLAQYTPHKNPNKQACNKEETLEKVFKTYPESDMMRWTLDRSEDVYHSHTREPLGKSWNRGHSIPSHLGNEVPFGQRINAKDNSAISLARSAIAPVDREYEVCLKMPFPCVFRYPPAGPSRICKLKGPFQRRRNYEACHPGSMLATCIRIGHLSKLCKYPGINHDT